MWAQVAERTENLAVVWDDRGWKQEARRLHELAAQAWRRAEGEDMGTQTNTPAGGDVQTIGQTRDVLTWFTSIANQGVHLIDELVASLSSQEVDPGTLAIVANVQDACNNLNSAATNAIAELNTNHGGIAAAVADAPVDRAASNTFYDQD